MAWWEGIEETRLLIAPVVPATTSGNAEGNLLSLCHPKSGKSTCYFFINGCLQELHWFKQAYGSWFLGDYACEDGRLYTTTQIDPVFILLPIFEEARMKKADDQGKFRQLDEIMFINGYPGYQKLISIAEDCMKIVCEIKEIASTKFFRLDDTKVLSWLCHKVHQLKMTLPSLDKNYAAQNEKDLSSEAVSLLGEYLKDEPWLKLLCNHLKLGLPEATRKESVQEFVSSAVENTHGSYTSKQETSATQKKISGRQAKKGKIDTESRNIKDMFSRASRRKT